jgi:hypothetical protein
MDSDELQAVTTLLQRPGAVASADGLAVTVRAVRVTAGELGTGELEIVYSVPSLPDAVARQPLPGPWHEDLATYASEVAEELQAWAIEHVRKYRPLPAFDREQVQHELPPREQLWLMLTSEFRDVHEIPGGFVGTSPDGPELHVMLTPERWQDFVVTCEIGCRSDYGVDADSAGAGPQVALCDLEEVVATMEDDERYVVLDGYHLEASTRAELPPVPGTATQVTAEDARLRASGGSWFASDQSGDPSDRFPPDGLGQADG